MSGVELPLPARNRKRDWLPCIRAACAPHGVSVAPVTRSKLTTQVVFCVGGTAFVKFFTCSDAGSQEERERLGLERAIAAGVPCGALLGRGVLRLEGGRALPYMITQRVEGKVLRDIDTMRAGDFIHLAHYLGLHLRALHDSAPVAGPEVLGTWARTLVKRRAALMHRPLTKRNKYLRKALSESALAQLDEYLPENPLTLIAWGDAPAFLHGDLNDENVLLKPTAWGAWVASGIIDFGDCVTGGHRLYDFIAVHLSVFGCDKDLLVVFLHAYGWKGLPDAKSFAFVCMALALLSDSPALRTAAGYLPQLKECATLQDAAALIFDVTSKTRGIWSSRVLNKDAK